MLRKSPHILITTPESLHIMLTTRARARDVQRRARGDRRRDPRDGRHEARRASRADARAARAPRASSRRSASVSRRRSGRSRRSRGSSSVQTATPTPALRPCTIVDCGLVKQSRLSVESPVDDLAHVGGTIWTVRHAAGARAHARRAHDARLRQQSRAGREDGGAHQRARRRGARAAVSRLAVARAAAACSSSRSRPASCARWSARARSSWASTSARSIS